MRERDELLFAAWHTAHLTAYAPAKSSKFVKLDKLINPPKPAARKMAPQEIEATMRGLFYRTRPKK